MQRTMSAPAILFKPLKKTKAIKETKDTRVTTLNEFSAAFFNAWMQERDRILTTANKLTEDFFVAMQKGIFPKNYLIPESEHSIQEWWIRLNRFIPVFSDPNNHTALTLLTDKKYYPQIFEYIWRSYTVANPIEDSGTIHALPCLDLELGKLVFANAENMNCYEKLCDYDLNHICFEKNVLPTAVAKQFQLLLNLVAQGRAVDDALNINFKQIEEDSPRTCRICWW